MHLDTGHNLSGAFVDTYVWNNYGYPGPPSDTEFDWDYIKVSLNGSTNTMNESGLHLHTSNAPTGTDPATAWRAAQTRREWR